MTERDALLRSILDNPWCDTARLVFADYLDEQGNRSDSARAEFIRVQCELAPYPNGSDTPQPRHMTPLIRWIELRARERDLLDDPHPAGDYRIYSNKLGWVEDIRQFSKSEFTRGFVSRIELPTSAFLEHAEAIFRAHPVTNVRLLDATIFPSLGNDTFFVGNLGLFPVKYWRRLDGSKSTAICLVELDAVCVAFGREKAGLPELEPSRWGREAKWLTTTSNS